MLILVLVFIPYSNAEIITASDDYREDVVIISYSSGLPEQAKANYRASVKANLEERLGDGTMEVLKFKNQSVEEVIQKLSRKPGVKWVEPDYKLYATEIVPSDTWWHELWGMRSSQTYGIDAHLAWDLQQGSEDIIVAVIDSGIYIDHPDLVGRFVAGYDFFNNDSSVYDGWWDYHGTHVAGTIAANMNNIGVVGVAPNVKIMPLKFLGQDGGYTSDAIEAIYYARDNGADIINASWGGGRFSKSLERAIGSFDGPFVAAAGNDSLNNDSYNHYPSSYKNSNIVAVASTDMYGQLSDFSNYGVSKVDIAAPGSYILSTMPMVDYNVEEPELGYYWLDGTSMATPHVVGVLALMMSENPNLSTDELIGKLYDSSVPNANLNGLIKYPAIVNAFNAVNAVSTQDNQAPLIDSPNSVPENQALNVSINSDVIVRFNEAVVYADSLVSVYENDVPVSISSTQFSSQSIKFNFGTLSYGATYRIEFGENAVSDDSGNTLAQTYWFETEVFVPDTTPPTIDGQSSTPNNNAIDVPLDSEVIVVFDEVINIDENYITVFKDGVSIGYTSLNTTDNSFVFELGTLAYQSTYDIIFAEGAVSDSEGNTIQQTFTFTTVAEPSSSIQVLSTSPANGDTGVRTASPIKVTFEQAISTYTIDSNKVTLSYSGGNIPVDRVYLRGGESIIVEALGDLPKSQVITVTLNDGLVSGNNMSSEPYSFSFTTKNK